MLDRSPSSRVVAFEPFPGNHPYLDESVGNDARVTIVKAAVADQTAPSTFLVGKTVTGSERGWERFVGYSSAGYVIDPSRADPANDDHGAHGADRRLCRRGGRAVHEDRRAGREPGFSSQRVDRWTGRSTHLFVELPASERTRIHDGDGSRSMTVSTC